MKKFIKLKDNKVVAIRYGKEKVKDEIESKKGKIGEKYNNKTKKFFKEIETETEINKKQDTLRIKQLKKIIDNKNYAGVSIKSEQAEIKKLLGYSNIFK